MAAVVEREGKLLTNIVSVVVHTFLHPMNYPVFRDGTIEEGKYLCPH